MIRAELMPIAWHSNRLWDFSCRRSEKKEQNQFLLSNAFNVYNLRVFCEY